LQLWIGVGSRIRFLIWIREGASVRSQPIWWTGAGIRPWLRCLTGETTPYRQVEGSGRGRDQRLASELWMKIQLSDFLCSFRGDRNRRPGKCPRFLGKLCNSTLQSTTGLNSRIWPFDQRPWASS
jgi:hypothetical protein